MAELNDVCLYVAIGGVSWTVGAMAVHGHSILFVVVMAALVIG